MREKKFKCLIIGCRGELEEIDRKCVCGKYDLIHYKCLGCDENFYMPDFPKANLSHEKKQSLISRVGQT